MYTNYNEVLTASCCVNKDIDENCNAKCFLEETEENETQNQSITLKKAEIFFCQESQIIEVLAVIIPKKENVYFYKTQYSFLYGSQSPRPPIS